MALRSRGCFDHSGYNGPGKTFMKPNTLTQILGNRYSVWIVGTIIAFICFLISMGKEWACGLMGVWVVVSIIAYYLDKYIKESE